MKKDIDKLYSIVQKKIVLKHNVKTEGKQWDKETKTTRERTQAQEKKIIWSLYTTPHKNSEIEKPAGRLRPINLIHDNQSILTKHKHR